MPTRRTERFSYVIAAAALVASVACSDAVTAPTAAAPKQGSGPSLAIAGPNLTSKICVVSPPGVNDYTLSFWEDRVALGLDGLSGTVLVSGNPFSVESSQCVDFFQGGEMVDGLWVRQVVTPPGVRLDSITVARRNTGFETDCAINPNACPQRVDGTDQVYVEMWNGRGVDITFYNSRPAPEPGPVDTDADGIYDVSDNCPSVKNARQLDLDDDGLGTACDPAFNFKWAPLDLSYVCGNVFRVRNNRAIDAVNVDYAVTGRVGYRTLAVKASARDQWFSELYFDAGRAGTVTLRERGRAVDVARNGGVRSCPASVLAKL